MNKETMYGYPISSIFFQIGIMILLLLVLFFTFLANSFIGMGLVLFVMIMFWYVFIYNFKKRFSHIRKIVLQQMKNCAQLTGFEHVLDLGTGAGYIAVEISKMLNGGKVVGVDKYDQQTSVLGSGFFEELKINFFGNTLNQARKNAVIEHQKDSITFVKSDLKKHFPFSDNAFDIIFSSQFLYCIPAKKIDMVLYEINRVLKPGGKLVFFESKKVIQWDISHVRNFYTNLDYETRILSVNNLTNKCIFSAQKPKE